MAERNESPSSFRLGFTSYGQRGFAVAIRRASTSQVAAHRIGQDSTQKPVCSARQGENLHGVTLFSGVARKKRIQMEYAIPTL